MSEQNNFVQPRKKLNFNFGLKGWLLCLYVAIAWMTISGSFWMACAQNVMAGNSATVLGVEQSQVLTYNSIAGYISVFLILIVGVLFSKYKARIVESIMMIGCGIALFFYGTVSNVVWYVVIYLVIDLTCNSTSSIGLPQICAAYFPTKKGSFLGWATIGANCSALVALPILSALITNYSRATACTVFAIFTVAMGVINWIFIPNTPEEAGMKPDNGDFTTEELNRFNKMMSGEPVWTVKEAMRNKNFWLLAFAYGLLFMASTGFLQQYVPYMIAEETAAGMTIDASTLMTIMPVFAVPGSIFSGWLDQRIGTRKTGMIMAVFYVIAGLCAGVLPFNSITKWVFTVSFFWWTGANANLGMSHAISAFGPRDYPNIWGHGMAFIVNVLRVTGALSLSISLSLTSSYRGAYTWFMIASIVAFILLFFSDHQIQKEPGMAPTGATK